MPLPQRSRFTGITAHSHFNLAVEGLYVVDLVIDIYAYVLWADYDIESWNVFYVKLSLVLKSN